MYGHFLLLKQMLASTVATGSVYRYLLCNGSLANEPQTCIMLQQCNDDRKMPWVLNSYPRHMCIVIIIAAQSPITYMLGLDWSVEVKLPRTVWEIVITNSSPTTIHTPWNCCKPVHGWKYNKIPESHKTTPMFWHSTHKRILEKPLMESISCWLWVRVPVQHWLVCTNENSC